MTPPAAQATCSCGTPVIWCFDQGNTRVAVEAESVGGDVLLTDAEPGGIARIRQPARGESPDGGARRAWIHSAARHQAAQVARLRKAQSTHRAAQRRQVRVPAKRRRPPDPGPGMMRLPGSGP